MSGIKKSILLIGLIIISSMATSQQPTPNILFIMSDDHSAATISVYESHLQTFLKDNHVTPHLDKLASEGTTLTNCYANNSLCAPSRASIITGRYSHTSGVFTLRENLEGEKIPTVAQLFNANGYQTAVVGKWHVEGDCLQGYDYYAITHGQGSYYKPSVTLKDGSKIKGGSAYVTDFYTDLAVDWLNKYNNTKPFFLMVHHKAAHGPWQYKHEDPAIANMFDGQIVPEPATLFDDYSERHAEGIPKKQHQLISNGGKDELTNRFSSTDWATGQIDYTGMTDSEKRSTTYQKYLKDYLRCVKSIDNSVGTLYNKIKEMGILENTIIIYTSDQGMFMGEHNFYDKRLSLDEALRMPFIIRYPPEIAAGIKVDEIVNNVDFANTFCDYADITPDENMQGISFRPILAGGDPVNKRTSTFFQYYSSSCPNHYGIRTKTHKLLRYTASQEGIIIGNDLFDLENDPDELVSIYNDPKHITIKNTMEDMLDQEINQVNIPEGFLPGRREWKLHNVNFILTDGNNPVSNAIIEIYDERLYTPNIVLKADQENNYLTNLHPYDHINIKISAPGYETIFSSIDIPETKNITDYSFSYILTSTPTGIKDFITTNTYIFPNPTRSHFKALCPCHDGVLIVSNPEGKEFFKAKVSEKEVVIDCSRWPSGIYMATILCQQTRVTQKLILR
ncbi:DUF4976 domain-containing protein [Labilibacter sediminis]|nr:DUF4976 domain-containing protein [Labilibacter sediminis]